MADKRQKDFYDDGIPDAYTLGQLYGLQGPNAPDDFYYARAKDEYPSIRIMEVNNPGAMGVWSAQFEAGIESGKNIAQMSGKSERQTKSIRLQMGGIAIDLVQMKQQKTLQSDDTDWLVQLYRQGADSMWVPDDENFAHSFENAGLVEAGLIIYDNNDKLIKLTPQGIIEALRVLGQYR